MLFRRNPHIQRLHKARKAVTSRFDHGTPTSWRNKDFEKLSFQIKQATKVHISAATLKRIYGKNKTPERYYPQEATLEALEKYGEIPTSNDNTELAPHSRKYSHDTLLFLALVLLTAVLIFVFSQSDQSSQSGKLELLSIDGSTPATVRFVCEIPEIDDSIFIAFGDKEFKRPVDPTATSVTHVYRHPGRFACYLYQKDGLGLSDTLNILIPSDGWSALASYYNQSHKERYFPIPIGASSRQGIFHADKKLIASAGMDTTDIIEVRLDHFGPTQIDGDHFELSTRLKNIEYWPALRCYAAHIYLVGAHEQIMIKLTNKGCSGWGACILSEQHLHGGDSDLSAFSVDIQQWNDIVIKNENKSVQVLVNERHIFNHQYQKPLGKIVGVSIVFHGSGFVDYFELKDGEGKASIIEQFGE